MVKASVKPSQFRQVYIPMFTQEEDQGPKVTPCTTGAPKHLSVARPTGGGIGGRAHPARHAAPALLPDNITTDHLPSNAILPGSAAGNTWRRWACRRDFNSPTPPTAAIT